MGAYRIEQNLSLLTQGPSFVVFGFLSNHFLHCICFKILFRVSNGLVSNWSYVHFIKTIKNV